MSSASRRIVSAVSFSSPPELPPFNVPPVRRSLIGAGGVTVVILHFTTPLEAAGAGRALAKSAHWLEVRFHEYDSVAESWRTARVNEAVETRRAR